MNACLVIDYNLLSFDKCIDLYNYHQNQYTLTAYMPFLLALEIRTVEYDLYTPLPYNPVVSN